MSQKRQVCIVVGTRPNFIKVTQFKRLAAGMDDFEIRIVHTGQHYDEKMATVFFDQFGLRPDTFLEIPPAEPGIQIASTIESLSRYFSAHRPDLVMVVGDVNATLAAAIAANKKDIPVAHLESGLRSNDLTMPEEHNRRLADVLAQIHFITEDAGLANLRRENAPEAGLSFVGNTMIDTLVAFRNEIEKSEILQALQLIDKKFGLITIHRPSNVDTREGLELVLEILKKPAERISLVFPVHPRTMARMEAFGLKDAFESLLNLKLISPLGYFDFQKLVAGSEFVLTDSGGIQEETTFLQKPCLTLRPNTERPITVTEGSNILLPFNADEILRVIETIFDGSYKKGRIPALWDGKATGRVLERIASFFERGY